MALQSKLRQQQSEMRPHHRPAPSSRAARLDLLTVAIYGVIATYVWRWQDLFPVLGKFRPAVLALGAVLALFAFDRDRRRSAVSSWSPISRAGLGLLALAILSVPGSLWPGRSFYFIMDDFAKNVVILFAIAAATRTVTDTRRFVGMILIGGIVYAGYINVMVPIGEGGRLGGLVYYDANDLGMLVVASLPLALFFVLRSKSRLVRLGAALAIGLFIVTVIKTGSRGAFLALIAVGIYVLTSWKSVRRGQRYGVVIVAVVAMMVLGGDRYWQMMGTLLHPKEDYNWSGQAESGRMEVWRRGIGYMFSHPILGVGARCFPIAEGELSPLAERQRYGVGLKWSAAHNSYVQVGAELGVFGLFLLLQMVFESFRTARQVDGGGTRGPPPGKASDVQVLGEALGGSVIGFAVAAFFLSQGYAAFFMILCGTIVGFRKVVPNQIARPARPAARRRKAAPGFPSYMRSTATGADR